MTSPPTMIPFGDLGRTYRRLQGEIDAAVGAVLGSGWFILGGCLAAFERDFACYCEVEHAIGVASGTDAIALALRAVGVGPGDEVITAPLSAAFTALAISQIGATPVFADIDPARYTLDPAQVEAAITPRTRAILPVHLYGQPAEMDAILAVARSRGLAVVEDAAQAHGARYRRHRVGALADAAAFSFYPSKNLGAFGDAGMVTTNEPAIAHRLRQLRNGGQSSRYRHEIRGVNSRLDELQAAILGVRLRHLDADNARRRRIAARYTAALAGEAASSAGGARDLAGDTRPPSTTSGITPPFVAPEAEPVFHLYVVRAADRAAVAAHLDAAGIETAVHYPTPIHLQPAYLGQAGMERARTFPQAERAAGEVLSLPIYPELTDGEVDTVAAALAGLRDLGR